MGWTEAADMIINGMEGAISKGTVTYDFERLMDNAPTIDMQSIWRNHYLPHECLIYPRL